MRLRKKKWVKPFLETENKYLNDSYSDIKEKTYLEIGMGMGDFITESAFQNKDTFYIGLEKDETCVARAIKKANDLDLNNLMIILNDASKILEYIPSKSIDRIYLHFSDPWPKKAHHKRRLTYNTFIHLYSQILKDKGEIVVKTDNVLLFEDTIEYFKEEPYELIDINRDYHSELYNEPMTAYQKKFSDLGQPIYYLKYKLK